MTAVEADVTVDAGLARYEQLTRAAMAEYLEGIDGANGWLDELVRDYPARGGKAIRPALCLATSVAFGGTVEEALPSAVAIELMHNAFLVHDDIEDGSTLRRGQPTLHQRHGTPLALNAGDALVVRAAAPLRVNRRLLGGRMASQVSDEFERMTQHTVGGQATELGWRRDNVVDLGPDDYLDLIMRKTCWYTTIHPLRIGALIGSWGSADLDLMVRFGFHLGAAFQIRDDLLNLEGDEDCQGPEERSAAPCSDASIPVRDTWPGDRGGSSAPCYGKEWCGDLYEGKRTLMVIHLLSAAAPAERDAVVAFLAKPREERTASEVADVLALMKTYGSLDFARAFGEGIASAADEAFEDAFADLPDSEERAFVHAMIGWMLSRAA